MPRTPALPKLEIDNLGPIRRASLEFGDLTVLVGPQASGKSIALQALELVSDHASITSHLRREGFDWNGDFPTLLDLYFGEGMRSLWEQETSLRWGKTTPKAVDLAKLTRRRATKGAKRSVFYIPAHRALTLKNGWPRHFGDYLLHLDRSSPQERLVLHREYRVCVSTHSPHMLDLVWDWSAPTVTHRPEFDIHTR